MNMDERRRHRWGLLGRMVARRRQALGWTQEELANRAGVHVRSVVSLESGVDRTRRPPTADKIVYAVGFPRDLIDGLVYGDGPGGISIPEASELPTSSPPTPRPSFSYPSAGGIFEKDFQELESLYGKAAEYALRARSMGVSSTAVLDFERSAASLFRSANKILSERYHRFLEISQKANEKPLPEPARSPEEIEIVRQMVELANREKADQATAEAALHDAMRNIGTAESVTDGDLVSVRAAAAKMSDIWPPDELQSDEWKELLRRYRHAFAKRLETEKSDEGER